MIGSTYTQMQGQPRTEKRHVRKRLSVSDLKLGMYVAELDRPWEGAPFLFQGFTIETDEDLRVVQHVCQWVIVELTEDEQLQPLERVASKPATSAPRVLDKREFVQQITEAKITYHSTKALIEKLFTHVQLGENFSVHEAQQSVQACVERVIANTNAILWLTRLKDQDSYTAEHSVNVCLLAIALGRMIDLKQDELEELGICALLHDIGKMKVPPEVLNKPGKLDPNEYQEMQRHSEYGRILLTERGDIFPSAIEVSFSHHERIDGKGYPRALNAEDISLFTRIVSIVDSYDAMTSDRCYKAGMSSHEAMRILHHNRNAQFDANLVDKFIAMIGLYPPGYLMEMTNGEVGIILSADVGYQLKPNVIMILDADKKPQPERIINLAHKPQDNSGNVYEPKGVYRSGMFGVSVNDYINKGLKIKGFEYAVSD